ncbi:MAG: GNAT family N-acetyltransferase [Sphingomonadales bacterium]
MTGLQPDLTDPSAAGEPFPDRASEGLLDILTRLVLPAVLIEGERVYLHRQRRGDWKEWSRLREASRAFLEPWEPTWQPDHLTRRTYRRRLRLYARDRTILPLFVFSREDNALLGGLTLGNIRRGRAQSGTLGYWMGLDHAGNGYMTDALKAVIPFAFDRLGLHRLEAACLPNNEPSRRLLERCGFRLEGKPRSYLKINGSWRDHLLFAITDDDPRP